MIMLLSYILAPVVVTEAVSSVISYPPQSYLSWSKIGEIPWLINYTNGYIDTLGDNDRICLRSGPIKCGGESYLRMENISGPSIIQFNWKTDARSGTGQLVFNVDGKTAFECYDRDWTGFSYPLSADRSHCLEWTFKKIKSYPLWEGAGWIDDINLVRMDLIEGEIFQNQSKSNIILEKTSNQTMISNYSEIAPENVIDADFKIPKQEENRASATNLGSNITIYLQNIIYAGKDSNDKKSRIIIKPKSPKDDEILSNDVELEFEYEPSNCSRITNCSLLIDNIQTAYSHDLNLNLSNKFILNRNLNEVGSHSWQIECCECAGLCNSSKEAFFKLAEDNVTTYVDPLNPDEAHFRYSTISQAISNTSNFGMIIIKNGTYDETIEINRPVTIIGNDKPLLLPGPRDGTRIITINSSDVEISGLRLQDANYGIYVAGEKEEGVLKNINITNNEIYNCGYDIFAEYCCNSSIISNILYYPNKTGICHIGLGLKYCKNMIIDSNRFNEAFRVPKEWPMDSSIDMLCYENKTMEQITNNTFDYSNNGVNIQQEDRRDRLLDIKMLLKKNNNTFNMADFQIIGTGETC